MSEPPLAEKLPLLTESLPLAEDALLVENLSVPENPSMAEPHHCQKVCQWWKHNSARKSTNGGNTTLSENPPMVETQHVLEKHTYYELHLIMLYTMIDKSCHIVSFVYNIAKALMFPKIHQSTLVLLCLGSLANSLVLFVLK